MSSKRSHRTALFTTGVALGLSIFSGVASADPTTPHDPSGNNGTIKVDGIDYDDTPANEPHVGCSFQIDFFGFDLDDRADVRFFAQPPSGDGQLLHEDLAVLVSDDAAAGGPNDIDERVTYDVSDWDTSALTPSPQQGLHVKVEANVVGAPGGAKQKVFWIDCPPVVTVPPIEPVVVEPVVVEPVVVVEPIAPLQVVIVEPVVQPLAPMQPVVVTVPPVVPVPPLVVANPVITTVASSGVASEVRAAQTSSVESQRPSPQIESRPVESQVMGVSFARSDTLPRTGDNSGLLALVGGLVLAVGTVLTRMGRVSAAVDLGAARK